MTNPERETTAAFVAIANALVEGGDPVNLSEVLTGECARLLGISCAGVLLADPKGALQLAAASRERLRDVEMFQLCHRQGPYLDAFHSLAPVLVAELAGARGRWPAFVAAATAAGYSCVHVLPLRLPGAALGALGLFGTDVGALDPADLALARGLAHVASVALVTRRAAEDRDVANAQLQHALTSRIVVEQAKGFLAQAGNLDTERAFTALHGYARHHKLKLGDLAAQVVGRELPAAAVLAHPRGPRPAEWT